MVDGIAMTHSSLLFRRGLAFDPWIVINKQSVRYSDFRCRCARGDVNVTQAGVDGVGWHIAESGP